MGMFLSYTSRDRDGVIAISFSRKTRDMYHIIMPESAQSQCFVLVIAIWYGNISHVNFPSGT